MAVPKYSICTSRLFPNQHLLPITKRYIQIISIIKIRPMYRSVQLLLLSLAILSTSCQSDHLEEEILQEANANIQSELFPYFDAFKDAARDYGMEIDYNTSNVTAKLEYINDGSVAGTCSTNGHDIRDIVIDKAFWDRASYLSKEMVIFHELGHCILGRGHSEGSFQNGICKSIMRSGLGNCSDAYTNDNRDYFIQELFNEKN